MGAVTWRVVLICGPGKRSDFFNAVGSGVPVFLIHIGKLTDRKLRMGAGFDSPAKSWALADEFGIFSR